MPSQEHVSELASGEWVFCVFFDAFDILILVIVHRSSFQFVFEDLHSNLLKGADLCLVRASDRFYREEMTERFFRLHVFIC